MPIRGGSPPPQGGEKKKFRSRSPPPRYVSGEEGDAVPWRSKERGRQKRKGDRRSVVAPLEIPSREREESERDVTPRATKWDDESDTEDESERGQPHRHRGVRKGPQSGRRAGGSDLGAGAAEQWREAARWKEKESKSRKKRRAPKQEPRGKEDDARQAQAVFQQAYAMHEAALMDEEHRKRFHSHQMVFTLGALLFLLPLASLSVFKGVLILAFPILGMLYGIVCVAAAWSSHQVLLTMVVGGVVPMLARVSIAMYVLAVMTRQCRHAASCEGAYAIGWFGLAGEMFGTLVVSVAATHHMLDTRKTRVAQETAVLEAADNKMRAKGVAELKQSLRKSFKAWGSELELIFKDFDEDGNGMMDREELCKGLKTLGADFSDEQAGWLFDKIDVDNKGEIDYRTFASWFGTTKQAERAKLAELKAAHQELVLARWKALYENVRYTIRKTEQLANIRSGHGHWDKAAIEACFDEFDDGDGELEVGELHEAFELLQMDPSAEEVDALLTIYDADGSGTLDRNEFVRMMYEFIQSREPPSDEEGEGQEGEDSNGVSDPYVKLKMGATGNERKTKVLAKTLNPVFAQTFQLKLRRLPRRVGDQILRMVVYDFDRLDSDDVIGHLELDMWEIFDKNWAQEIDQTWPLGDDYGDVDKKVLRRAPANKEHLYGTIRLRLGFHSADYASDESFSDEDVEVVVRSSDEEEEDEAREP